MEGKDNRSVSKRKAMKQLKNKRASRTGQNTTTSSSTPPVRGVADYVDSSDEKYIKRAGRWLDANRPPPPAQQNRCYDLDLLDDLDDEQNEQMRAADFQDFQTPSIGGHFKFSSEKNWDAAADVDGDELLKNTAAGEYFTLNLKLLNTGLRTIPFFKRMDYAASMFTNNELTEMEKEAENAEKEYQLILEETSNPKINVTSEGGSVKSAQTKAAAANGESGAVDEIVSATEKASLNDTPAPVVNDIQEWLDNVLEEGN